MVGVHLLRSRWSSSVSAISNIFHQALISTITDYEQSMNNFWHIKLSYPWLNENKQSTNQGIIDESINNELNKYHQCFNEEIISSFKLEVFLFSVHGFNCLWAAMEPKPFNNTDLFLQEDSFYICDYDPKDMIMFPNLLSCRYKPRWLDGTEVTNDVQWLLCKKSECWMYLSEWKCC